MLEASKERTLNWSFSRETIFRWSTSIVLDRYFDTCWRNIGIGLWNHIALVVPLNWSQQCHPILLVSLYPQPAHFSFLNFSTLTRPTLGTCNNLCNFRNVHINENETMPAIEQKTNERNLYLCNQMIDLGSYVL